MDTHLCSEKMLHAEARARPFSEVCGFKTVGVENSRRDLSKVIVAIGERRHLCSNLLIKPLAQPDSTTLRYAANIAIIDYYAETPDIIVRCTKRLGFGLCLVGF